MPTSDEVFANHLPEEEEFRDWVLQHRVRIIIDGTEFRAAKPVDTTDQKAFYSVYKSAHTVKYLIGLTPAGRIRFASVGFPGSISDGTFWSAAIIGAR